MAIYIYIYIYGCVQVTSSVTINNVTPLNNLLLNLYFENLTVGLLGLYILNIYAKFYENQMLIIIQFIISFSMYYFKL